MSTQKVIAITGAASGIGLALAHKLASQGHALSLADLSATNLSAAKTAIETASPGAQIDTHTLDVRDPAAVDDWIASTVSRFGRLDGAADLAGVIPPSVGTPGAAVESMDGKEWDFVIGVNLTGVMHCLRAQLRVLGRGGSVVVACSTAGLQGRSGRELCCDMWMAN